VAWGYEINPGKSLNGANSRIINGPGTKSRLLEGPETFLAPKWPLANGAWGYEFNPGKSLSGDSSRIQNNDL